MQTPRWMLFGVTAFVVVCSAVVACSSGRTETVVANYDVTELRKQQTAAFEEPAADPGAADDAGVAATASEAGAAMR